MVWRPKNETRIKDTGENFKGGGASYTEKRRAGQTEACMKTTFTLRNSEPRVKSRRKLRGGREFKSCLQPLQKERWYPQEERLIDFLKRRTRSKS